MDEFRTSQTFQTSEPSRRAGEPAKRVTMDPRDAATLEWEKFLTHAESEAKSFPAREAIASLNDPTFWATDIETARLLQSETQEMAGLLTRDGLWGPLSELPELTGCLESLARGSVLELEDFIQIRRWLYALDSWSQIPRDEIRGERFKRALTGLPDPHQPLRIVDRILTPEGGLSDRASPKLYSLSNEIRGLRKEISVVLDQLIKTFSQKGILQENFSDQRDGRYVIPVKISNQGEVDGIIYEASASRQTVFVEPKEVGALNNRLRRAQNDLIQETFRVLEETSAQLRPFVPEIGLATAILTHWDIVQARARVGTHFGGKSLTVTEERGVELQQSSHPLLAWAMKSDAIIRNGIDFGEPTRTLLITGPNTGGKTVLLKMIGLAGICARTGFPFPAIGQPSVPFFDSFFVDLGDPQSIEHSLSSFSGHIERYKRILENITPRSLVLIDELNSATDPEEGAALGRAFLEVVMSKGALIVATTHDPHLKALAISDDRILNASMAFDEASRMPTYSLVTGVPGRSRALETAERLGLPAEVLDLAKTYLSKEHLEFERMLSKLELDTREAGRARHEAVQIREEAERLKKEWTERTESSVNDMLDRTRQKLRRILEQAQDEVRSSVRKLDEMRSRKEVDQARGTINQSFNESAGRIEAALREEAPDLAEQLDRKARQNPVMESRGPEPAALAVGASVRVPRWKTTGTIMDIQGNKIKVAMGTLQMTLAVSDIELLISAEAVQAQREKNAARLAEQSRPYTPPSQLDLRGQRLEEAMSALESYLDQAYRSGGLASVTVVHGLGTGALREGARKLFHRLPYIKEFRDGGAGQGGSGATIVEFDRD